MYLEIPAVLHVRSNIACSTFVDSRTAAVQEMIPAALVAASHSAASSACSSDVWYALNPDDCNSYSILSVCIRMFSLHTVEHNNASGRKPAACLTPDHNLKVTCANICLYDTIDSLVQAAHSVHMYNHIITLQQQYIQMLACI